MGAPQALAQESDEGLATGGTLLTRADSIAIARAVAGILADRPAVPQAPRQDALDRAQLTDSVRRAVQRALLDSLLRSPRRAGTADGSAETSAAALRALGELARPPRRIVVAPPRPMGADRRLDAVARALADSVRRVLDAHPRYLVVPADSVIAAFRDTRTIDAMAERLQVELFVAVSLVPSADSLVRVVQIRDLSGSGSEATRIASSTVAHVDAVRGLDRLAQQALRSPIEMELKARGSRTRPPARPPARPR